jgi:hypothetical protein
MGPYLEDIHIPAEIQTLLRQIDDEIRKRDLVKDGKIFLSRLTKKQEIAFTFFGLFVEVDELVGNLNLILTDLDQLCENPCLFVQYRSPLKRYKLLLRSFFYEFSRFEDLFGYFMVWLERLSIISREERKTLRDQFYRKVKPMVDIRNTMLHHSFQLEEAVPQEIFLLEAAESTGYILIQQLDGTVVDWKAMLSPVCAKNRDVLFQAASDVRDFWCEFFAHFPISAAGTC